MESQILQNFIEEAENYLPMVRCEILLCSQEGICASELETSLRYVEAIKEAARAADVQDIVRVCENLNQELILIVGTKQLLSDAQTRNLLDQCAELEALLA